ncbi:hypothetical protein GCM10007939_07320 [Amylibacter marinus]|uniref:Uncharacterized protein n=1 Tax=Amylibacter marinus TaxID=1475483 RepID=A0ABQ5VSZ2_9RHOB|nr:hypothetical protein [Amylibacter marinus]GLQ34449.1 hypothetical protein GCM10007939_07320 [Amylibacter marinus]
MNKVLIVGVITLPLVMFYAMFATNVMTTFQDNASDAEQAARCMMCTAYKGRHNYKSF